MVCNVCFLVSGQTLYVSGPTLYISDVTIYVKDDDIRFTVTEDILVVQQD